MRRTARLRSVPPLTVTAQGTQVASDADDGFAGPSAGYDAVGDVIVGDASGVGDTDAWFAFQNITIPQSVTFHNVRLVFTLQSEVGDVTGQVYRIRAAEALNPTVPASGSFPWSLTLTTAFVDWDLPAGSAPGTVQTPDLSSILSELNATYDYSSGGRLVFTLESQQNAASENYIVIDGYGAGVQASLILTFS